MKTRLAVLSGGDPPCPPMVQPNVVPLEQVKMNPHPSGWGFVCDDCAHIPPRGGEPDYVTVDRRKTLPDGAEAIVTAFVGLHYPHRCRACERAKKRFQRMRKRVERVFDVAWAQGSSIYRRPKLITFALPSAMTQNREDRNVELAALEKRLPAARRILKENGIRGGTYVTEVTSRSYLPPFDFVALGEDLRVWKHHAHIHMVAVAPFMQKKRLIEFSTCLTPIGLGRINYEAPRGSKKDASKRVARYISKYLVKDGMTSRTWGVMRNG
jgi:hypothetical protein